MGSYREFQMKADAKKCLLLFITVLLVVAIANGCASSPGGTTRVTQEGVKLTNFSKLSLEVKSGDDVSITPAERERILNLTIGKIKKDEPSRFKEINSPTPSPSTLHVSINVTRYEKTNVIVGLGQLRIDAEVVLEDREKQEALAKYKVTKASAFGGIFGGVSKIEDVEEDFANAIAALLLGKEEK